MDIRINNNLDFQARLFISGNEIYGKGRNWNKISKKFEKLTKDYPEDTFIVRETDEQLNFKIPHKGDSIVSYHKLGEYEDCSFIKSPLLEKLMELKDESFVKILATLFKIQKHSDDFSKNVSSFVNNNPRFLNDETINEHMYYTFDKAIENYVANATQGKQHALLHDNMRDIYIHTSYTEG